MNERNCPYCGSKQVYRFQQSPYTGGEVKFVAVNPDAVSNSPKVTVPDVDVHYCANCQRFADPYHTAVRTKVVTVNAIQDRILNLEKDLDWKKKNYQKQCDTARKRIAAATDFELPGAKRHLDELTRLDTEIKEAEAIISTLERILEMDTRVLSSFERRSMIEPEIIGSFRGNYAFLSNFHPCVIHDGMFTFQSAEAAFQSLKVTTTPERWQFQNLSSSEARKLGHQVELRRGWELVRVSMMRRVVYMKFTQNKALGMQLLDTGNAHLQEMNYWGDTFWGTDMDGNGENHLGRILMDVREDIRRNQETIWSND